MDQLRKLLNSLSLKQKISIGVAAILVIAAIVGLTRWRTENDFKALYTSLSPEDAAAVIQKLKESGTEYRVSDSGASISAPSARVAELRLDLAAAGIPKTGRIGYELFDKTNFGATEFTEHLNFHRALEGELERSIDALASVDTARVHLTFPKESVFLDSREPAKASVLLKLRIGSRLTPQNVAAITNLVASAVEGLSPEAVSVLDMRGNLLNRPHHDLNNGDEPPESTLEYRQKIESDLLAKVNATLEPLLGAEKFRAGVSVDCDFTTGEQSEETVDPTKSVMVTSQKSEEQAGSNTAAGQPGTASTLPRPTSRPGSGANGLTRRTENLTFQSSRLVKHTKLAQGSIKKISISVLVDHLVSYQGKAPKVKRVLTAPTPEMLKSIHDLVAAATGFSTDRGDQLVVEALPFEATLNFEPPAEPVPPTPDARIPKPLQPYFKDFNTLLIGAGSVAGFVVLLLASFFLFRKKKPAPEVPLAIEGGEGSAASVIQDSIEAQRAEQQRLEEEEQKKRDAEALAVFKMPVVTTKKAEVLLKHIRETSAKDGVATANVMRAWMNEAEKETR